MLRSSVTTMLAAAVLIPVTAAVAKTPGTTYCYKAICHTVKTLGETAADLGKPHHVLASYYDAPWRDRFNPSLMTSSGEMFRPLDDDTAASPKYPDGTTLLVYVPGTGGTAVVRVNDAGPYWSSRLLDLSRGAAEKLGFARKGLAHVVTVVVGVPTAAEARYSHMRSYEPLPGYIGTFASLADAKKAWLATPQAKRAAESVVASASDEEIKREIVVIGKRSSARRQTRIVLKPVRLRRPLMLAAIARRKAKLAAKPQP